MYRLLQAVWTVFLIFLAWLTVYGIIPTLSMRMFFFRGSAGIKNGRGKKMVCLTFDDGPDARYTARLLDVLKKNQVQATFFVVGERALKNPVLLKRMKNEGHLIGIHHYNHFSNWFLTPNGTRKQCRKAADAVASITGERPVYYRPPWGHINLLLPFTARGLHVVLWSAILGDWRKALGEERLKKRILNHMHDGAVICLHDNGENPGANRDAPTNTIAALNEILPDARHRYDFVTVGELFEREHARQRNKRLS
ncbi:polysaccharide deacetylase family protein [Sporolactobacillus sp. KGMB 08714]|uniref:polysaccharide deacetylase family protein n=1 Tax=Sporolactobacillus sp. KGMB 08714 TaxID=3064704 RepID=UPI002FBE3CE9